MPGLARRGTGFPQTAGCVAMSPYCFWGNTWCAISRDMGKPPIQRVHRDARECRCCLRRRLQGGRRPVGVAVLSRAVCSMSARPRLLLAAAVPKAWRSGVGPVELVGEAGSSSATHRAPPQAAIQRSLFGWPWPGEHLSGPSSLPCGTHGLASPQIFCI